MILRINGRNVLWETVFGEKFTGIVCAYEDDAIEVEVSGRKVVFVDINSNSSFDEALSKEGFTRDSWVKAYNICKR